MEHPILMKIRGIGRRNLLALLLVLGLGLLFTVANLRLPILRNSLIYGRITGHLLDHHMKIWEVCSDPDLVYNKACGFPAFAAPLVWPLGPNQGLKLASFLATALLVLVAYWFFKRFNPIFGLDERWIWLEILLVFFNPLLIYQFWSAYSDPLFAALFLLSFILLDAIVRDQRKHELRWTLAYTTVLILAVFTKHHALLLFVLHPIYLYWRRDLLFDKFRHRKLHFFCLASGLALAAGFVALGMLGRNPLLNLRSNSGQYDQPVVYADNVKHFALFLGLTFSVLLLAALPKLKVGQADVGFMVITILYAHILMVYHSADHNMRWYVPILPLMALYIARAFSELRSNLIKTGAVSIFLAFNLSTILVFNHQASSSVFASWSRRLPIKLENFDNFRLETHRKVAADFDQINQAVPPGGTLYWLSKYYGDSTYHIFDHSELLRSDIQIKYARDLKRVRPHEQEFFVYHFNQYLHQATVSVAVLPRMFGGAAEVDRLTSDLHRVRLQQRHSALPPARSGG